MATAHMPAEIPNPSFVGKVTSVTAEKVPRSTPGQSISQYKDHASKQTMNSRADNTPTQASLTPRAMDLAVTAAPTAMSKVETSLHDLSIAPGPTAAPSISKAITRPQAVIGRVSVSDDSQRADSSSELDTKPPSLDGKSITSGTTFALDEKESLRPDDSASVKAAAEDDDSSIRESIIAGSRMGSDLAIRARGIQLGDMPDRSRLVQQLPGAHGVHTPQSATSEQPAGLNPQTPLRSAGGSSDALNVIYRQAPDEKLLEALAAPRDRLFLLRMEKDVIDFVQNSKEPYMDLPPSNSFCRMLTHKLADYYHMTHSYEPHIGSVRIFRTPFCRVPPSLATMIPAPAASTTSTPPPVVLPRKIMRRGQDDEGGLLSAGASKPTSENGSDAKEKQPLASQKLSREEREEAYKLARQRIFGNMEETSSEADGECGMSRTNSAAKSANGKRGKTTRPRRDDSDSFESRRQYTSYWGAQQQAWMSQPQAQYLPAPSAQYNAQPAPAYPPQMGHAYGQHAQQPTGYPSMPGASPNPTYSPYPQYASQPSQQRYQPPSSPMTAFGSPVLPAAPIAAVPAPAPALPPPPSQAWQTGFNQPPSYQNHGVSPPTGPAPPPGNVPYPFGQLPAHANPHDPKSQHPIPGSYNRNHAFNPKIQSFVPGGSNPSAQALQPPFSAPGSHQGSPQIGVPHLAYAAHPGAMPPPPYGGMGGGGYPMARQGSNNSLAACFPPPHMQLAGAPTQGLPAAQQQQQHFPTPQHLAPSRAGMPPPRAANQLYNSHLMAYGGPASVPQNAAPGKSA